MSNKYENISDYDIYLNENNNIEDKKTNPFTEPQEPKTKLLGKKVSRRKDNIRCKILNHFITYIFAFLNNYVKKIYAYQKVCFIKIKYEDRKIINIESIKSIMDLTINEFCQKKISSKNKIYDENNNSESFQIIKKDLEKINFVNLKLSEFYNKFYLCKDLEYLNNNYGIDFNKTKNFYCLLNEKNDNIIEKQIFYEIGINLIDKFIKTKPRIRKNNKIEKKNKIFNLEYKIEHKKNNNINIDISNENELIEINDSLIGNNQINDNMSKKKENKNYNIFYNIESIDDKDSFLLFEDNFSPKFDEFQTIFD